VSKAFLNIGGGSKLLPTPSYFQGWRHDLLDIDPSGGPDIVLDARQLHWLPAGTYDAVYCSHNLEHYHRHDGAKVVRGMLHVLKPDGFAEIRVPDIEIVLQRIVQKNLDIDDVLYQSVDGPILVRDVLWGYHVEIERSGHDFFAHHTGFSRKSLIRFMAENGFPVAAVGNGAQFEIIGYFFRTNPRPEQISMLKLPMELTPDGEIRILEH
jgi:SAM-dependent methyltransferase